ncbi:MAG: hypothetical protein ABIJ30_04255 [bacterium]
MGKIKAFLFLPCLCNVNKIFTTLPLPAGDNLILKYLPIIVTTQLSHFHT